MTKHTRLALTAILALVAFERAASLQAPAGPAGHWEGAIQTPAQELRIEVDLAAKTGDKWEGTITIPEQHVKALPLSAIVVQGNALSFAMKGVPGDPQFQGTASKDGKSISGDFRHGGATLPFTLAWKGEAKIEQAPESTSITEALEGSWEGSLDAAGTVLRLVLKLSNQKGGATGTLVSVDQGGGEIPVTSITQTDSHLKLIVSVIGGLYEGDLKNGQLIGTWTQGGKTLPLVFKRVTK